MPDTVSAKNCGISSVTDLSVGDGIYSNQSESSYWVIEKTRTKVILEDVDGRRYTWMRPTLDASFSAHEWVRQT